MHEQINSNQKHKWKTIKESDSTENLTILKIKYAQQREGPCRQLIQANKNVLFCHVITTSSR